MHPRLDHLGHPDTETLSLRPMDSVTGSRQDFYFTLLRERTFQSNPWHILREHLNAAGVNILAKPANQPQPYFVSASANCRENLNYSFEALLFGDSTNTDEIVPAAVKWYFSDCAWDRRMKHAAFYVMLSINRRRYPSGIREQNIISGE